MSFRCICPFDAVSQFWTTKNSEPILAVAPEKKLEAYGMLAAAVIRKDAAASYGFGAGQF
jgi:hypothetical protein